jgi:Fe-S-cluster-containing dehydrogenase component
VPVGNFWNKVLRIGPNPKTPGAQCPDGEMYFLPLGCQHCVTPECVAVCPTEASHKLEDGTVQIDKSKCIGCQFCVMACPYNVRYLNETEGVVEKCTLCEQKIAQGELPQCVDQCGARARFFGDIEKGIENLEAPGEPDSFGPDNTYGANISVRIKLGDYVKPFTEADVYHLNDVGNQPSFAYILRNRKWQGGGQ